MPFTTYYLGTKLKDLIELYSKKVKKNFGDLVTPATLKAAKCAARR